MPVILQGLDPRVLAALRSIQAEAAKRGIQTNLLSAVRTPEDQKELFANFQAGRAGQPLPFPSRGAVPLAAAPGTSLHERGLAFDLQAADPSRQSELWSIAPSYGLKALGMRDPAHFELAGGGAAPVAVASSTAPSNFLRELQQFEAGGKNINNVHQMTSSGQAQGFNQITTGTWADFGGLKYAPNPQAATQEQQNEIAFTIPLKRWAPETLDYLRGKGFQVDPNKTLGENVAMNGGGGAVSTSASASSNPANPTDWQSLLGAEAPPEGLDLSSLLGSAVGSLGQPSTPSTGGAGVETAPPPAPMTDFSFAPIEDSPETLGARYAQNKDARKLSSLGQLFTIKTIGQPGGKPPNPYSGGIG
jgi:hypothetical protein